MHLWAEEMSPAHCMGSSLVGLGSPAVPQGHYHGIPQSTTMAPLPTPGISGDSNTNITTRTVLTPGNGSRLGGRTDLELRQHKVEPGTQLRGGRAAGSGPPDPLTFPRGALLPERTHTPHTCHIKMPAAQCPHRGAAEGGDRSKTNHGKSCCCPRPQWVTPLRVLDARLFFFLKTPPTRPHLTLTTCSRPRPVETVFPTLPLTVMSGS